MLRPSQHYSVHTHDVLDSDFLPRMPPLSYNSQLEHSSQVYMRSDHPQNLLCPQTLRQVPKAYSALRFQQRYALFLVHSNGSLPAATTLKLPNHLSEYTQRSFLVLKQTKTLRCSFSTTTAEPSQKCEYQTKTVQKSLHRLQSKLLQARPWPRRMAPRTSSSSEIAYISVDIPPDAS